MSSLYLIWDESQLWGLLAWNALKSMGVPFKVVRSAEISDGILQKNTPSILMVPGGTARHKAESLGQKGRAAIQNYVQHGGNYLGFCGGAGLGLNSSNGLGLCPWTRASYEDRMQHFMSGHVFVDLPENSKSGLAPSMQEEDENIAVSSFKAPALPVWWPGHFMEEPSDNVEVLARYALPADDFWLADLPISMLPEDAFSTWSDLYGLSISPDFLTGQPCIIHGDYKKGSYTLSYSHLETPLSPFANNYLKELLNKLGGINSKSGAIAEWNLGLADSKAIEILWENPFLMRSHAMIEEVINTGLKHSLLFKRNSWLLGWRQGLPGSALGGMHAVLCSIISLSPTEKSEKYWKDKQDSFMANMELFAQAANNHLLAERLALTLSRNLSGTISAELLKAQRHNLFGPPMQAGGLYNELMQVLDELAFLQISGEE